MKKKHPDKSCRQHRIVNVITWLQILLQIIFPVMTFIPAAVRANENAPTNTIPSPFSADHQNPDKNMAQVPYEGTLSGVAGSLSSSGAEGVEGMAVNATTGYASDAVQQWLDKYGTARVQLNVDQDGNWDNSSFDFLAPLYDNKKSLLFTQIGLRAPDGRTTTNIGMGIRTFYTPGWMYGANVFFDDDITGNNRRIGLGAEAWTDNLKLSANTYLGTTEWHSSDDFDDYNEKPADGYDVRAEAYLPSLPQLGAKLMYEQYYGDKVALFDKDDLQSNPSAVTFGLNYTPFPLITASIDYKRGQDSMDETQFGINFRYTLGQKFEDQISPSQVADLRSLAGSRYDLVERNNEIVLQYQKKKVSNALTNMALTLIKDNSPADGVTANSATITATTQDGSPARNATINWTATGQAKLSSSSSVTDDNGNSTITITDKSAEQVVIQATSSGVSRNTTTTFAKSIAAMDLKITTDKSAADGKSNNAGTVLIKDANGKPMPDMPVSWKVNNKASIGENDIRTNEKGEAGVKFSSSTAGSVTLTASSSGKSASANSSFISESAASIDVTAKVNNAPADGKSTDTFQALVEDASGQPVSSATVNWSLSGSTTAKLTSPASVQTDAHGIATVNVENSVAEKVAITATSSGLSDTDTASFSAVLVNNLAVSMTTNNAPADNLTTDRAQARITDANGQPVKGAPVTWRLSGSTTASLTTAETVNTDANGVATVSLKDSVAESVTLTAESGGESSPVTAVFIPVSVSHIAVSMTTNNAPADNLAIDQAQALITDANGQPVKGVPVTWRLSGSTTASLTTAETVNTDANGVATVSLKDSVAESVTLTAEGGGISSPVTAVFIPVSVSHVAVSMVTNNSPADNGTTNVAQAIVTGANGQPLQGVNVSWSISGSTTATLTSGASATTGNDGVAIVSLKDSVAEPVTVTATADTKTGSTTATFTAIVAKNVVVKITKDNSLANNTDLNIAQATVTDGGGKPVANMDVNWSLSGVSSAEIVSDAISFTDQNGKATVSVKDGVAESVTVMANASQIVNSAAMTFTNVPVGSLVVTVEQNNAFADGADTNQTKVVVRDSAGQPISGESVTWSISGSSTAKASTPMKVSTNQAGEALLSVTDTKAESSVIITAATNDKSAQATIAFISQIAAVAVTVQKNNAPADNISENILQVKLTDAKGLVVPNANVEWSLASGSSATATSPMTVTTDSNGMASLKLVDSAIENVSATARAGDQEGTGTVVFTAAAVGSVDVSMKTNNVAGNGTTANVAQAVVLDANNQPMKDVPVTWVITGSTTAKAVSSLTVSTDANGTATLSLTDTVGEGVTVTANAGGKNGQTTATFASAAFGPVTVLLEHSSMGSFINIETAQDGVDITVSPYPGMAAGDQLTVKFKVKGELSTTSTIPLTDYTFPVHTVTAQEVGQPIVFTVPADKVLGLQPMNGKVLKGTATAMAINPTTQQQSTGSVTYAVDTLG